VNDGLANGPVAHAAHGTTPFGFAFDKRDRLIVSEAFADAPGASAVSSYDFDSTNSPFDAISGSVRSGQTSAWGVVTTRDGHYAFVANTGSATLSGYRITRDGKLSLLTGNGISASTAAGSMPQDLALTEQGGFLFALTPGTGTVDSFSVGQDGSLKHVANTGGIPASAQGLAVH
jgi:6-phosphogluconolactonase